MSYRNFFKLVKVDAGMNSLAEQFVLWQLRGDVDLDVFALFVLRMAKHLRD